MLLDKIRKIQPDLNEIKNIIQGNRTPYDPEMLQCPECGLEASPHAKFCIRCRCYLVDTDEYQEIKTGKLVEELGPAKRLAVQRIEAAIEASDDMTIKSLLVDIERSILKLYGVIERKPESYARAESALGDFLDRTLNQVKVYNEMDDSLAGVSDIRDKLTEWLAKYDSSLKVLYSNISEDEMINADIDLDVMMDKLADSGLQAPDFNIDVTE